MATRQSSRRAAPQQQHGAVIVKTEGKNRKRARDVGQDVEAAGSESMGRNVAVRFGLLSLRLACVSGSTEHILCKALFQRNEQPRQGSSTPRNADPEINKMQTQVDYYAQQARLKMNATAVPQQRLESAAALVVRYMLFKQTESPHHPIPVTKLNEIISSSFTHKVKSGTGPIVIAMAQSRLSTIFGLEMLPVTTSSSSSKVTSKKKDEGEGPKSYVLRTMLPRSYRDKYLSELPTQPMGNEHQGLLMALLFWIQANSGKLTEEELWEHLSSMGVHKDVDHPALGRPAELLDSFVKMKFVKLGKRTDGPDGLEKFYEKGEHAIIHFVDAEVTAQLKEYLDART